MKISIGSDHRGFELKKKLLLKFTEFKWIDVGAFDDYRSDYPIFAQKVCGEILSKNSDCGVLICGSGIGMSIAANRFKGIYAGLCWSKKIAKLAKEDDGINVLVLPADFLSQQEAFSIFDSWINSTFLGGRYQQRLDIIDKS